MNQSPNSPIAARTRLQTSIAQQLSSEVVSSTQHQETNEDFAKLNINDDERNDMIQKDIKTVPSLPTSTSGKQEVNDEQFNKMSHSNLQLQLCQENLMAELAQKQKIIEEQKHLLLQLQSNIQELMTDKHHQQQHEQHPEPSQPPLTDNKIRNNTPKYDNFIEQQLLKEKISNIKKFSGNKHDDVDEWLENIEHDFSSTLVSEDIKLKIIPKSLTNDAENWFQQNKHRLISWRIFKVEIQHRFRSSLHKDEKFTRLRERKQQLKETGQQFIDAMEKLCFQVNPLMMEQEKMLHIKAGLRPSLKEKVLDKQPQSMQELRNTVKRMEDIETMLNKGNSNDDQIEHPSFSSNSNQPLPSSNFEQQPPSLNFAQSSEYDGNCYAIPSQPNNFYYRRNNYRNQNYHQQRPMNRQEQRLNNNYPTRNRYDNQPNQYQSNQGARTGSSVTPSTNDHSKKY
jgi:hypothetical protein